MAERPILHVDMNNYYASVEEKYNPALRRIPFAVCGDPEMRHNIVMSKNSLARQAGVVTGISFYQARKLCPGLGYVKADYPKYLKETKVARAIYLKYTDTIIPYGMDESWVVLDNRVSMNEARQIADIIRIEIMYSMGLSASVGVSFNYVFSKIGSDYKKPNATTVITKDNYRDLVWPLPASDLLFVGSQRKRQLASMGIKTIGGIAGADPKYLGRALGKVGFDLWQFANGDDKRFKPNTERIGSIGNAITPPEDLRSDEDASAIIFLLVSAVCARLKKHGLKARCVSLSMKDNKFNKILRQRSFHYPTDSVNFLFNQAYGLFKKHYKWNNLLRALGVRVDSLDECEQLSFINNDDQPPVLVTDINQRIQKLTARLGRLEVEKAATSRDW